MNPIEPGIRTLVGDLFKLLGLRTYADLRGADISVKPPNWTGLNVPGWEKEFSQVKSATMPGVDLRYARATGTFLVKAELDATDLRGANFVDADLRVASLAGAKLQGANLTRADLRGTILTNAKLNGANLSDARFDQYTNLNGADLSGADISGAELAQISYDGKSQWQFKPDQDPSRPKPDAETSRP